MLVYICQVYSIFIKCLLYNVVYNYCLECKVFALILVYSPIYYPYVTISPSIYPMKILGNLSVGGGGGGGGRGGGVGGGGAA